MDVFRYLGYLILAFVFISCNRNNKNENIEKVYASHKNYIIVDCNYTFAEAVEGTKAPKYILDQLELITVHYYSMDGKMHQGQLLANKRIVDDLRDVFREILRQKFPVCRVIPIVKYNWDDNVSMQANNTYSFCFRNASYSKHAFGMAIDINPMQNPCRWKPEFSYRKGKPEGAVYNINIAGTFNPNHPIVRFFAEKGFMWGHYYSRNYDDHHFEKK